MYELFEHTADLGLRATAPTPDALFAEMAACLVSAMVEDPARVQPAQELQIEIAGTDREFLLFDWLKELLLRFETDRMLFAAFDVRIGEAGVTATVRGEPFDPDRHTFAHEVKAITYHELKVVEIDGAWLAEVIVDI
ncbi:Marine sediment metagenome DNA, contig: S01H1_S08779 OS=marine sediment metagenome GN=S01H1_37489 PE=4 SV=1: Archease [Gemmata massiliana]|uniref:Archease domain-containing protein n=1 Tax=Gemmata massiliana TaxID=1210884 RepID=A0A6P2D8X4_9BACT|nr:archease [Gemmata massiliana]VTR95962.1 Marine sediment metagenome DNA, contig: S01H1_S08779 OS=marine sediment metagenome GN=S01H1_37489 PE=4 SV=1: Archease [Gemmata massiliana]